jgi:hypothetical protein
MAYEPFVRVGEVTPVTPKTQEVRPHSILAYMYSLGSDGEVLLDPAGRPLWQSENGVVWIQSATAFSSKRPAGYFMVNTGNSAKDAVATIALNEMGVDNYVRAVDALTKALDKGTKPGMEGLRYYGIAARETVFAAAEIAATVSVFGGLAKGALKSRSAYRAARAAAGQAKAGGATKFGFNQPGGFLNRTKTALFGGQYVDPAVTNPARTVWRNGQRVTRPGGPALQTRPNAFAAVVQRYKDHGLGIRGSQGVIRGTLRSTREAVKSGFRAILPQGQRAQRLGVAAYPASVGATAVMRSAGASVRTPEAPEGSQPSADSVFQGVDLDGQIGALTASANQDALGIQRQYSNLMRELQQMFQLSETEEEKDRLRFMLADIEAQKDAGLKAISDGYAQAVGAIRERATISRQQTTERADTYRGQLNQYADDSQQRMIDQQAAQVAGGRGLGTNVGMSATNEWNPLQRTLASAQGDYTQRMGDITAEGIDWMADTTGSQGLAQQADLQRMAAATRSSAIMSHQGGVANRINQERMAMNNAMLQLSMASIGAGGSSAKPALSDLDLREYLASLGASQYTDTAVRNYLEPIIGRKLTTGELAISAFERQKAMQRANLEAGNAPAPLPTIA